MKKGFTLIELLAVIIILGVLAVIVIPTVSSAVRKSKIKSFLASAHGIIKTAEIMSKKNEIDGLDNSTIILSNLEYNGRRYETGSLSFDEQGEIAVAIWNQTLKSCAIKGYADSNVNIDDSIKSEEYCVIPSSKILNMVSTDPNYNCYEFDESTRTIVSIFPTSLSCTKLIIPTTINGVPVEIIGNSAVTINQYASEYTITSIDFSKATNLIDIEDYAFEQYYSGGVTSINFRNLINLESIGSTVFSVSPDVELFADFTDMLSIEYTSSYVFGLPFGVDYADITIILPTDGSVKSYLISSYGGGPYCLVDKKGEPCMR